MKPSEKLAVCAKCDKQTLNSINLRKCTACGCILELKAYSRYSTCPLDKWVKQEQK